MYGTTHTHLVHMSWPLSWALHQMGHNFATFGASKEVSGCLQGKSKGCPPSQEQSQPPNGLVWLCKQLLERLPNQPRVPLPPPHQLVQHTPCLSCKLSMCNN